MDTKSAEKSPVARLIHHLAATLALFGGLCLVVASALTGLSIIGGLAWRPLPGEIELVEALCGFAVFAFMPFCQLHRGHVGVDILIGAFGPKAMTRSQLLGDSLITILFALLAWRHGLGMADKFGNGETTPLLLLPVWWGYAIGLVLLLATVVVSLYTVFRDIDDLRKGHHAIVAAGSH